MKTNRPPAKPMPSSNQPKTFRKMILGSWLISATFLLIQIILILSVDRDQFSSSRETAFEDIMRLLNITDLLAFVGIPVAIVGSLWTLYHITLHRNMNEALVGFETILIGLMLGIPGGLTKILCGAILPICIIWEQVRDRVWPPENSTGKSPT